MGRSTKIYSPKSDPQRGLLCRVERELNGNSIGHVASHEYLCKLSNKICRYYRVPALEIHIANKPKQREYAWVEYTTGKNDHKVFLNRAFDGQNAMTLLHELAHYVTDCNFKNHENHGKEFVAIYMHLLHKYKILPQDAFRVIARRWNIQIGNEYLPCALNARPDRSDQT